MGLRYYKNGPQRTLTLPLANSTDTSITLSSVSGFPSQFPYTLIIEPDLATEEVVDVTAAVGSVLTITRGVDSTTAVAHPAGSVVYHGISARDAREANEHVNATANVHGASGSLVDTASVQTITGRKVFDDLETTGGGDVVTLGVSQTITGQKTFTLTPTTTTNGDVATLGGTQTFTGAKTFGALTTTGAVSHSGSETHSGTETHSGNETHSGTIRFSHSQMQPVVSTSSSTLTGIANTTFAPGVGVPGFTFDAPPSGKVWLRLVGYVGQATNGEATQLGIAMRTGAVIGSGTDVSVPDSNFCIVAGRCVTAGNVALCQAERKRIIAGLTPGATYNVRTEHQVTGGSGGQIFYRECSVEPIL